MYTKDTLCVSKEPRYSIGVGFADTDFLYREQPCLAACIPTFEELTKHYYTTQGRVRRHVAPVVDLAARRHRLLLHPLRTRLDDCDRRGGRGGRPRGGARRPQEDQGILIFNYLIS